VIVIEKRRSVYQIGLVLRSISIKFDFQHVRFTRISFIWNFVLINDFALQFINGYIAHKNHAYCFFATLNFEI